MPEDKIMDQHKAIIPQSWQWYMCLQVFRSLEILVKGIFEFWEQLELTEEDPTKKGLEIYQSRQLMPYKVCLHDSRKEIRQVRQQCQQKISLHVAWSQSYLQHKGL